MFSPSKLLEDSLNAEPRDMYDIIGALMGYINADPAFLSDDFSQAVSYVLAHGVSEGELYSEFDPEMDYEEDSAKWNEEYYSYARLYLKENFCKKRIKHVEMVAKKVYSGKFSKNQEVENITKREEGFVCVEGGSQSTGKKPQGQQSGDGQGRKSTTQQQRNAITIAVILIIVDVLLAVATAFIILK